MSAKITLLVGEGQRKITPQELSLLNSYGCIERNPKAEINWTAKATVRFVFPSFAIRGLSCRDGAAIALMLTDKDTRTLAQTLLSLIHGRREAPSVFNPEFA